MAINKAMYNGVQDIMNAYDRNAEVPFYSVWAGRDMVFSYNDEDAEKGRNHLLENLIACEQNEHTDILKIKFHPKKEKTFITDKTPAIATLFVRVCDVNNRSLMMPMQNNFQNPQLMQLFEKQNEILSGLHNRISAIEEPPEDESDYLESESSQLIGRIEGILNNPLLNLMIGFLSPKIQNLMQPNNNNIVTSLSGVEDLNNKQQLLNDSLERLNLVVDDLPVTLHKLANYADKNKDQFNMLLKML